MWNVLSTFLVVVALCGMVTANQLPLKYEEMIAARRKNIATDNTKLAEQTYTPDWASLDSRPIPDWYDDAKFGIIMHWGVYSVPSFKSVWFWIYWRTYKHGDIIQFMRENYPPNWRYEDFASQFHAELFNASDWITLFQRAGAKYIAPTSKHHDGFCLWNSKNSWNWNSVDIGPHRDLIAELRDAVIHKNKEISTVKQSELKAGDSIPMRFGVYHSLYEWYNPLYLQDKSNQHDTSIFVENKLKPELRDLVSNYSPEYMFSDGDWEASSTYWESREFLAWLYNESPVKDTIVVNDRWGNDTRCKHGGIWNCNDRYNPRKVINHKWENAFTIDRATWGFSRTTNYEGYLTMAEILDQFISTIARGGNVLLDVGPTSYGRIPSVYEERLLQLGEFLEINGEAVYRSTTRKSSQKDSVAKNTYYTVPKTLPSGSSAVIYAFFLNWPSNNILILGDVDISAHVSSHIDDIKNIRATLLGSNETVTLSARTSSSTGVQVHLPALNPSDQRLSRQAAWVVRLDFPSK